MQKFDIYKFLRILFLILAIISMIFALSGRVRAEGMDQYYRDYIHSVIGDKWSDAQWVTVEDYMNSMPYFILFKEQNAERYTLILLPYSSNDYYQARYVDYNSRATNVTSVNIMPWLSNTTSDNSYMVIPDRYGALMPYSLGDLQYSDSRGQYGYAFFDTQYASGYNTMIGGRVDIYDRDYSDSGWNRYWYDNANHGVSGFYTSTYSDVSYYIDKAWTKCNYNAVVIRGEYTSEYHWEQNVFIPEYLDASEDIDIDKTYVDGALGIRVKWSVLPFPESGSFNYAGYTSITLDFDCDGTDISVTLDSDDYPELFSNYDTSLPNNGSAYIPWSMVQKVKRLLQYADYDVISCTGCSITMSGYPSGSPSSAASEYTMVAEKDPPLVLKGQSYVETPEFEAASVSTAADRPTSVEEGSTYQSNAFSSNVFYSSVVSGSSFDFSDFPLIPWADYKVITLELEDNLSSSQIDHIHQLGDSVIDNLRYNLYDLGWIAIHAANFDFEDVLNFCFGDYSTYSSLNPYLPIEGVLHDNNYSDYYDFIVFCYNYNGSDYIEVYSTERYYIRLQFRAFQDLQTVLEADAYYMKNTYLLLDAVVSNIDSNLVDFFTSSLDVDSKMLFYLDSMNIKFDDLDRSVTSGTASIVAALNDLDTFDDSRIYNKLVELTGYIQALQTADSVNNSNTTILGQILAAINDIEYPDPDTAPDWVSALLEFLGDLLDLLNSLSSDGITVTLSNSNEPDTPQEYGFNLEIPDWSFSDSGFSVDQASLSGYEEDPIMQQLITELASDFFDKLKPVSYQLLDLMYENIEFDEDDDYDDSFNNANIAHFFGGYRRPAAGGEASSFFFFFTDQYDPYEYDGIVQND